MAFLTDRGASAQRARACRASTALSPRVWRAGATEARARSPRRRYRTGVSRIDVRRDGFCLCRGAKLAEKRQVAHGQCFTRGVFEHPLPPIAAESTTTLRIVRERSDRRSDRLRVFRLGEDASLSPLADQPTSHAVDRENDGSFTGHVVEDLVWIDGLERRVSL